MKTGYFPGCSLHSTAKNYETSTQAVLKKLDVQLEEIPDWNCCGSTPAHQKDHLLALALPARNLALAEQAGMKEVMAPCAACFNHLRTAEIECAKDQETSKKVQGVIEMKYNNTVHVLNILELLVERIGTEAVAKQVKKPLKGLRIAPYYGCMLTRPAKIAQFDDPTNPTSMDRLLGALGADVVPWGAKTECCGAAHILTRPDVVVELSGRIIYEAKDSGADAVATACPMCMSNLDLRQSAMAKATGKEAKVPIMYITELLGMAFNIPQSELGMRKHVVSTASVQAKIS
ncbi:MAG: CoB--CoM heterodisulfide reductase iron-sulfur subunit B family protein [Desulfitobacteriaceae bacterium]|nr:CoB--CoM heterodisulfide reductase iron-sulfur subunit B family protein [Desulfitobacteriaceae bacterium]MDI6879477.1 CoB--CoM heterodisulfide reductase iron-sulfur subunit B family protein [Desulfitobacteriaceae bacterium]MDI6915285.1 CoB--CoM heterodisulfide reductase iron-sulfur subunit B family protein [Desulfitobacteriaceae bacterium]